MKKKTPAGHRRHTNNGGKYRAKLRARHGQGTQHPRSCRCTGSVATSRSSARLNRTHLPFVTTGHVHHFVLALHWSISISLLDLLGGGHCLCTAGCRASPLRLRHFVSFRDIRPLSLYHSVYDLNSLRDVLDGRHPFLYCRCISLNCTCVVSTAFWIFRVAPLECSPLGRIAGT